MLRELNLAPFGTVPPRVKAGETPGDKRAEKEIVFSRAGKGGVD
ncbi:MAG: hypothetical protein RQ824_08805 [bacterium]|nr:hypothetical protein [bacterium]